MIFKYKIHKKRQSKLNNIYSIFMSNKTKILH